MDALLTEQEYADQVKVGWRTIRRLIQSGRLEASDFGTGTHHNYRIAADAVPAPVTKQVASGPISRRRKMPVSTGRFDPFA